MLGIFLKMFYKFCDFVFFDTFWVYSIINDLSHHLFTMLTDILLLVIISGLSKEYIDLKFTEISKKLDKMKFNLLNEIQKQGGNIKTQVIMNSTSSKTSNKTLTEAREIYKEIFSFDNLESFKKFDDKLSNDNERNHLKNLFEVLTYGEKDVNACVRKTLSEVITPEVQQYYSGAGRMIRGEGKLNFSATKTYVSLSG